MIYQYAATVLILALALAVIFCVAVRTIEWNDWSPVLGFVGIIGFLVSVAVAFIAGVVTLIAFVWGF